MMNSSLSFQSLVIAGFLALFPMGSSVASPHTCKLRLDAANRDRTHFPVTAEILLPSRGEGAGWSAEMRAEDGNRRIVQLETFDSSDIARVHWVESFLASGEAAGFTLTLREGEDEAAGRARFRFETGEGFQELFFGDRGVYRYITIYDPERHDDTHKPYHQLYRFQGDGFITKGPRGRFPHHKGIYLGWNKTRLADGRVFDFWHAPKEYLQHREFLADREAAGPVLARSASTTDWKTPEGETVVQDTREVTTWKLAADEIMLDYVITLQARGGNVLLDGDAHHSGFQFRGAQEVADNEEDTVIVRPPDAVREANAIWSGARWMALSFELEGSPYTVVHLDHSGNNPAPTTYSTRNYGRFGAFFRKLIVEGEPLVLKYCLLIKGTREGESVSPGAFEALHADYLHPASVRVVKEF